MVKVYPNSPLIEVVFEVRFLAELSIKCNTDKYYSLIKEDLPVISLANTVGPHLYDFISQDGKEIVKVGLDRFSYHAHEYKGGFEQYEARAIQFLEIFLKTYNIPNFIRTGLRYINHIPIVRIGGCIPLSKYLNFGYRLPIVEAAADKYEQLHTILLLKIGSGKLRILVEYIEKKDLISSEALVLDFDYFLTGQMPAGKVLEYVRDSHSHTKRIFEELITEDYRRVMESN